MPSAHTPPPRTSTSRALARSLLREALAMPRPAVLPVGMPGATRITPPHPGAPRWTRERCCTVLRAFVAQHARLPRQAEWRRARDHGLPSQGMLRTLFGSQNALTTAIGELPNLPGRRPSPRRIPVARRRRQPYTAEHLHALLTAFVTRHGRLPTRHEWRASGRHRLPDPGTIRRHYGSQAAFYLAMGLVPAKRPTGNQYTHAAKETPR